MSEEYIYYTSTQHLGKHGVTESCKLAMAAVLTSAFRPEKITAVIGPQRVLFLVWEWFYAGITIISDGFGTHGGEGGAGLSATLGLIRFYEIPLLQAQVYDEEAFLELAYGKLTEEMFDEIQQATQEYDWSFHPVSAVRKVKRGEQQFLEVKRTDGRPDFDIPLR